VSGRSSAKFSTFILKINKFVKRANKKILRSALAGGAALILALMPVAAATAQTAAEFDIVLANGRVMDPESNLDAVRNIGIRNGKIAAISTRPLRGKTVVDVKGLVIAPGFIDLHAHGVDAENNRYQARDAGCPVVRCTRRQIAHQFRRDCRAHPGEDGGDERYGRFSAA
jgi:hypothetical protein